MSSLLDALLLDPYPLEVWIAYRSDGMKGSGTLNDPWDGSTQAKFDAIMNGLPANTPTRVHLGPSPRDGSGIAIPFQTNGFWRLSNGTFGSAWQPHASMVICGAGFDVTHLRLVNAATTDAHYWAIGASTSSPTHFLEVMDLTIDCNLPTNSVACGAIRVMGDHVRIRNVKFIKWGSRTSAQPCFVVALIVADPDADPTVWAVDDAGIEDCIAVDPSANSTGSAMTVFHVGGRELTNNAVTEFGKAPFIRNCFIDCNSPTDPATEFRALSMSGCHGGVVEGNQVHNTKIGGPYQEKLNTRELIVRHNVYRNVIKGPHCNPGSASTGTQKLLIEGNNIDLIASSPGTTPIAIHVQGSSSPNYYHKQVIIRNNKVRYVDGTPGSFNGYGIDVSGAEALLVTDNVVEVSPANPIRNASCGAATYFNNKTPGGTLVQGYNTTTQQKYDEPDAAKGSRHRGAKPAPQ